MKSHPQGWLSTRSQNPHRTSTRGSVYQRTKLAWQAGVFAAAIITSSASAAISVDPHLPSYDPKPVALPPGAGYVLSDGTIQIVVFDDLEGVIQGLNELFLKSHPGLKFKVIKADNTAAIDSLTFDATAFAPIVVQYFGGQQYAHYVHAAPFGVRIAHASLTPNAKVSPLGVIVNKTNPLQKLSADEVARIFTQGGRKTEITQWVQVGVNGENALRPIHRFGLPWMDQYPAEDPAFGEYLFHRKFGGAEPSSNYESVSKYDDVVKRVSEDPLAIGITALNHVTPEVKLLELTTSKWSAPMKGTADDIESGSYPFDRYGFINVRLVPGKPFDPLAKEYLRMVLSREGQQIIASEIHGYLPLNATEVGEELTKLR